jgi:hypothetical protein
MVFTQMSGDIMKSGSRFTRRAAVGVAAAMAIGSIAASHASAGSLAAWNLSSNASSPSGLAATTVGSPATAGALSQNGTVSGNAASYSYDSKGFAAGVQGDNVEASLSVGAPTTVTDLVFSAFASSTGPGTIDVYYSADGGPLVSDGTLAIGTASGASATNYDVTFSSLTVNSSLNVYFSADASSASAGGGALGSSGTFRLNNVSDTSSAADYMQFEGSAVASAVPAPASVPGAIAGLGLLGGFFAFRRRHMAL